MDIKNNTDFRKQKLESYNILGDNKYNYTQEGVLNKCLPKFLFNGNNIFVTFLQLIDMRIIMLLKYVDILKRFKYINWYV